MRDQDILICEKSPVCTFCKSAEVGKIQVCCDAPACHQAAIDWFMARVEKTRNQAAGTGLEAAQKPARSSVRNTAREPLLNVSPGDFLAIRFPMNADCMKTAQAPDA
jgi:hypothetical protein